MGAGDRLGWGHTQILDKHRCIYIYIYKYIYIYVLAVYMYASITFVSSRVSLSLYIYVLLAIVQHSCKRYSLITTNMCM